jgi:hypothetical protein
MLFSVDDILYRAFETDDVLGAFTSPKGHS